MRAVRILAAYAFSLAICIVPAVAQEKRIALLIGNQSYDPSVGLLQNPHKDVALVGSALQTQGFELLPLLKDARRSEILGAVRQFRDRLSSAGPNSVGFLYYSGHGAAEADTGVNYLIPVDAKDPGSAGFWDESLKLDDVLKLLDGVRNAAKLIVFDACRNELRVPTKSTTKGLVPIAEQQGMLIAFASAPGKTASDRGENSGPFAAALAAEFGKPGLDHLNLFQNVKEAVIASTSGTQQPWVNDGLVRRVTLTRPMAGAEAPGSAAAQAWAVTKESNSVSVLESFVKQFPGSVFAAMAEARISELKSHQALSAPASPGASGWFGAILRNIDETTAVGLGLPDARGAAITDLSPSGPAMLAGLVKADVILALNGRKIADSRDLARKRFPAISRG